MIARTRPIVAGAVVLIAACAPATPGVPTPAPGTRTAAAIVESDLRLRLAALAHDSMLGRQAGTRGNHMGTTYIAAEAQRIGLRPAGEAGMFFQTVPLMRYSLDPETSLGPLSLEAGDFLPLVPPYFPFAGSYDLREAEVVFGGWGELEAGQAAGRIVIMSSASPTPPDIGAWMQKYDGAAMLVIATQDVIPEMTRQILSDEQIGEPPGPQQTTLAAALATRSAAERLLGRSLADASVGAVSTTRLSGRGGQRVQNVEAPARNVIAEIRGTDPVLRDEYVVIGAHNDHVGVTSVLDHDSVRAFNLVMRPEGAQSQPQQPTAEQQARIDQLRTDLARDGARPDSIHNGADDDASGSTSLLEVAEFFVRNPPKRSLLFVWHTGEELGMLGSGYFTENPTRPLDAMVAQINVDMVGRGMEGDLANGGMQYLQLIGSRRLSIELGDLVEQVNRDRGHGFVFDYQYDAEGHPQNIYCRSDHASYARFGIPVVFMTTGVHPEYHQVTDEIEYISFPKLQRVTSFIADVTQAVADGERRPTVNGPKPDPNAPCQQ